MRSSRELSLGGSISFTISPSRSIGVCSLHLFSFFLLLLLLLLLELSLLLLPGFCKLLLLLRLQLQNDHPQSFNRLSFTFTRTPLSLLSSLLAPDSSSPAHVFLSPALPAAPSQCACGGAGPTSA